MIYRGLQTHDEYTECVELQRAIWGEDLRDPVPAPLLRASQKVGAVLIGAFDDKNRLAGFVFGITGIREGRPAHWSHMLGVRPDVRGLGVGRRLKELQRERLLELGVEVAYWTYDPLVARNAHLNLKQILNTVLSMSRRWIVELNPVVARLFAVAVMSRSCVMKPSSLR